MPDPATGGTLHDAIARRIHGDAPGLGEWDCLCLESTERVLVALKEHLAEHPADEVVRRDHYLVQILNLGSYAPDLSCPFYARCACGEEFRESLDVLAAQRWGEHAAMSVVATIVPASQDVGAE